MARPACGGRVLGGKQTSGGSVPGRLAREASRDAAAAAAAQRAGPLAAAAVDGDMLMDNLGRHCSNCSKLDFLPIQCPRCMAFYCQECVNYDVHSCSGRHTNDRNVPICPLCGQAVPIRAGEPPDLRVERHIAEGCTKPKNTTRAIFTHLYSAPGCTRKEAVRCMCKDCKRNFCLRHRQPDTHSCSTLGRLAVANAAVESSCKRTRSASSTKRLPRAAGSTNHAAAPEKSGCRSTSQPTVLDAFSYQLQHQKKRRSNIPMPVPNSGLGWSCLVCTLRNASRAERCAVCGDGRPAGAAVASTMAECGTSVTSGASAVIDLCGDDDD